MRSKFARALLVILLLCPYGVALAQETEVEEEQPVVEEKGEADEQAPPAPEADTERERSPHDYRPSEDISEDLSVSFPVDI